MDDIATLIVVIDGKDADGFPTKIETRCDVFVTRKSVSRSEFYQSMQAGVNATAVFEMRLCDYEEAGNPQIIEHNGKRYKVIRTYSKDNEFIELTCSDLEVNDG